MKTRISRIVALSLIIISQAACVVIDDDGLDPGFVECGNENRTVVCQPGTYCSSPLLATCHNGCLSDVNCLAHEKCLKDDPYDHAGSCVPVARKSECCSTY